MQIAAAPSTVAPQFRAAATLFEAAGFQLSTATGSVHRDKFSAALEHAKSGAAILGTTTNIAGGVEFAEIAQKLVVEPLTAFVARLETDSKFVPYERDFAEIKHAIGSLARNLSPKD